MRTAHKALIVAISTALLTSTSIYAQVKEGRDPTGPSTSAPLGPSGLPGTICSGSSGGTCSGPIPDLDSISSTLEVTGCEGVIVDANIGIDLSHSFVGDLVISVTSPNATAAELYDGDCGGDNMFAVLDDSAATPVNDECAGATPTIDGTFRPSGFLGNFNGEAGNGFWHLQIADTIALDSGQLNDWSVEVTCGEAEARATFEVNKVFTDGNPADVDVTLNCFTGLPLTQTQSISGSQNVVFIVTDYDDGELDCEVVEEGATGYSAEYDDGTGAEPGTESCEYADLPFGSSRSCTITNTPIPVEVEVNKHWIIEGSGGDEVDGGYRLKLFCDNEIIEGYESQEGDWSKTLYNSYSGNVSDATYFAGVVPDWDGGTNCHVEETVYDSGVESDSDCDNILVELGGSASCTVTNTVFYEGIPTLGNYGLALLALMMLGLGFVGFRRFA